MNGFNAANQRLNINSYSNKNTTIFWVKNPGPHEIKIGLNGVSQTYTINEIISRKGGSWDEDGIIYIPDLNATIQLFEWKEKSQGSGALVNQRTGFTWKRKNNKFSFYINGIILARDKTVDKYWCSEENDFCDSGDYVVEFRHEGKLIKCILNDYKYARDNVLYPGRLVR
jgi:hypothetical protein